MVNKYKTLLPLLALWIFNISIVVAQDELLVAGQVTSDNEPAGLPGVNVSIKGTTNGTITDVEGRYSIRVPSSQSVMVFSSVGYVSQEIIAGNQNTINIRLLPEMVSLEEVVVVGYGTQRRSDITGAISTVGEKEIENRAVTHVTQALQGMVPGLNIVNTNGQPGTHSVSFKIRGTSTFSSNPVLVIIDGVPSTMSYINPSDIASISVLKDAASTAIYGSRATGGVILITTKTGKPGAPQISFNSSISIQSPTRFASKVSALQHMIAQNEMRANDGGPPKYSDAEIDAARSPGFKEWDWDDYMFNNALQTNQNISISGGTDVQDYYVSFGYFKQDGIFLNSSYEKFNIQLNQNIQATDRLKISYKLGYTPSTRIAPATVNWDLIAQTSRLIGIRTDDGKWLTHPERTGAGRNPLYLASEDGGQEELKRTQLLGNVTVDYEVIPDLFITGIYGMNNIPARTRNYTKLMTFWDQYNPDQVASTTDWNILDINNTSSTQQNISLLAKYGKTRNDHRFSVLAGITAEWFEQHNDHVNTRDFLTEELFVIDAGTRDKTLWSISGSASDWALASVISRVTYSYKGRYLLEGAMRYDGSSRFKKDIRWGLFPSASAGWILSEENFLKDNRVVDFLKLRGSWGQVGNQNVGFYPFADVLSQSSAYFGGSPYRSVTTTGAPNPLLTWETKEAINFGIEGSLFNSLLEFNVELFKEQTKDILLNLPLPTTFGQGAPVQNAGRVDNHGWEVELEHRHTIGDFGYGISVQVSDATNKVIDMEGISPIISGNQITEEGHPMDEWYGLRATGLFQTDEEVQNHPFQNPITSPGDIKYEQNGGDPTTITSDDRVRLGRSDARYPFGIRINLNYKNFDFIAFGQGVMYNLIYSRGPISTNFDAESTTIREFHLDRWSPENPDARFPKHRNNQATLINSQFSSFWLQDASYFRLKQIELGYSISNNLLKKIRMDRARIYVSAENLFVVTDYLGFDPEMPNAASYPLPRLVNFGVNLKF